jgi:uncharacterized membrane protein HdeD (DUF308 family)
MSSGPEFFRPPHSLEEAMEKLKLRWGWLLAYGALCFAFGLLALALVAASTLAVVFFVAIMLVVAGGSEIVLGFNSRDWPHFLLWVLSGLFYLVVGAYSLAQPQNAAVVLTAFAGFGFVFAGAARIWHAFNLPQGHQIFIALAGGVTILLGAMILAGWPGDTPLVLGTLFGVDLVFYGASWIGLALKLRR